MAAAPSGLRYPDDTPTPPGGTGPSTATLAGTAGGEEGGGGGAPTPEGGGPGGGMSAMLGQGLQQVQQTEMMLGQMASQFPAAAPALRRAQAGLRDAGVALRAALRQIMTNPGQPEPQAPAIGG